MANNRTRARGPLIRMAYNAFKRAEELSKFKAKDKARERSNRAAGMADAGALVPLCPGRHNTMAYSGPPHDSVRRHVCLICHADATEGALKDLGFEFNQAPDWIIKDVMDERLKMRFERGDPYTSYPLVGKTR